MGAPIISKQTDDPARFNSKYKKVDAEIDRRFKLIKKDLKKAIGDELKKLSKSKLGGNVSLNLFDYDFAVNADQWEYMPLTASNLASINELIQSIIDNHLLGNSMIDDEFFMNQYIELSTEAAAKDTYNNLSAQSADYAAATTIRGVLTSSAYTDVLAIAATQTLDDYKGLSDELRRKVSYLIAEGVAAGVSPFVLADEIADQGVSPSRAKTIARTEMIGAYRKARIAETERYKEAYGVKSSYMWLSALSPTTRRSHAIRHGKLYTKEDISGFYSKNGNRFNCKCSFVEVLINERGYMTSRDLEVKMTIQRLKWMKNIENANN